LNRPLSRRYVRLNGNLCRVALLTFHRIGV
jgi:hypothetical protein